MIACFHPRMKYGFFSSPPCYTIRQHSRIHEGCLSDVTDKQVKKTHLLKSSPSVIAREGGGDVNVRARLRRGVGL